MTAKKKPAASKVADAIAEEIGKLPPEQQTNVKVLMASSALMGALKKHGNKVPEDVVIAALFLTKFIAEQALHNTFEGKDGLIAMLSSHIRVPTKPKGKK